jgi:hypothetical protein
VFLAKLGRDLKNRYDEAHEKLARKVAELHQLEEGNLREQMKQRREAKMEHLKALLWSMHGKIMSQFRGNKTLVELEETLDTVKEFFHEESTQQFKEEVEELDMLNKNGHFSYICSRMDHYKELEKEMSNSTSRIKRATGKAKILVGQLTGIGLKREVIRQLLFNEFKKNGLYVEDVIYQAPPRPSLNVNSGLQKEEQKRPQSKFSLCKNLMNCV